MNANNQDFWMDLYKYRLGKVSKITQTETSANKFRNDAYVVETEEQNYLCEYDEYVTQRILIRIFKCVNFIKNFIIFSLICGIAYFVITFIQRNS